MGVLVMKSDGNKEFFGEAETFSLSPDGETLYVLDPSPDGNYLGVFPVRGWIGVRRDPRARDPRAPAKDVTDGFGQGRRVEKILP